MRIMFGLITLSIPILTASAQSGNLTDWVETNLAKAFQERGIEYANYHGMMEGVIASTQAYTVADLEPCQLELLVQLFSNVTHRIEAEQPAEHAHEMFHSGILYVLHSPTYEPVEPDHVARQIEQVSAAILENVRRHLPDFVDEETARRLESDWTARMQGFIDYCTFHGYKAPLDEDALQELLVSIRSIEHTEDDLSYFVDVRRWIKGHLTEDERRYIAWWEDALDRQGIHGERRESRLEEVMRRVGPRPTPERNFEKLRFIGSTIVLLTVSPYWSAFVEANFPELDSRTHQHNLHQALIEAGLTD